MKNTHPAINPTIAKDPYIHTKCGSWDTGLSAMHIAAAIPIVTQKRAEIKERRLRKADSQLEFSLDGRETNFLGACVKANSSPVMMIKASERATRMYAGAWIHTWILFGADM